jgi:type II secretory pathway pseudopilin PulG
VIGRRPEVQVSSADEAGFTLVELLVGAAMGVVLMGAVVSLVIGAVKYQPRITKKAENVTEARWVLERMTRELRNGERIEASSSSSQIVFISYERHSPCGSTTMLGSETPSVPCKITYSCTAPSCSRTEAPPTGSGAGSTQLLYKGINSNQVFSYPPSGKPVEATYVKVTFRVPDPQGSGSLTISDGASLRNATLGY